MANLTIGQLAARGGVGVETVRFYERRGLLAPPLRRPSGYRMYGEEVVRRLRFIRRAQELGFSLAEIEELLALRGDSSELCQAAREQAAAKLADLDERIADLERMRKALAALAEACDAPVGAGCPILDALERVDGGGG
ncbi:MAG: MerR family transcriptional regulator [Thermoanaerobaculia bacterium]